MNVPNVTIVFDKSFLLKIALTLRLQPSLTVQVVFRPKDRNFFLKISLHEFFTCFFKMDSKCNVSNITLSTNVCVLRFFGFL